ncbi:cysteine-rich receptor-like protein kinase, partial [Trifolium pratense]
GGLEDSWFEECISKTVDDGANTYFWIESWLGGIPLSLRFRRLLDLAENKSSTVKEMFLLALTTQEDGVLRAAGDLYGTNMFP